MQPTTSGCISLVLAVNGFLWLTALYLVLLMQIGGKFESATVCQFIATVGSLGHLAIETHKKYPDNGRWIVFNIFVVSVFVWSFIAVSGLCSPSLTVMRMFILVQGTMLTSRFVLDASKALGANIA
jgi:hypothetical protein